MTGSLLSPNRRNPSVLSRRRRRRLVARRLAIVTAIEIGFVLSGGLLLMIAVAMIRAVWLPGLPPLGYWAAVVVDAAISLAVVPIVAAWSVGRAVAE